MLKKYNHSFFFFIVRGRRWLWKWLKVDDNRALKINRCSISDSLDRFVVGLLSALVEELIAYYIGLEEEVEELRRRGLHTEH